MAKRILFFAAGNDISDLLVTIEQQISVRYYPYVIHDPISELGTFYESIKDIDGIGYSTAKDMMNSSHFLIIASDKIVTYIVRENKNGNRYLTANLSSNADFIYFTPGGIFANCVLSGEVSYKEKLDFNDQLMRKLSSEIKKGKQRLGSYYILKNARHYKSIGYRFTNNCDYPESHDIV